MFWTACDFSTPLELQLVIWDLVVNGEALGVGRVGSQSTECLYRSYCVFKVPLHSSCPSFHQGPRGFRGQAAPCCLSGPTQHLRFLQDSSPMAASLMYQGSCSAVVLSTAMPLGHLQEPCEYSPGEDQESQTSFIHRPSLHHLNASRPQPQ